MAWDNSAQQSDHHGHLLPALGEIGQQPISIGSSLMKRPRLLVNGKLCTEVTKRLVIINKDQETASTAQPALTGRQGNSEDYGNEMELCVPRFSLHGDATH